MLTAPRRPLSPWRVPHLGAVTAMLLHSFWLDLFPPPAARLPLTDESASLLWTSSQKETATRQQVGQILGNLEHRCVTAISDREQKHFCM